MARRKCCSKCGVEKPLSDFHFDRYHGQHRADCRECVRQRQQSYNDRNREAVRSGVRRYREAHREEAKAVSKQWREDNAERYRASLRRWVDEHPEARRAHREVEKALRQGLLRKPSSCMRCKRRVQLHAHHADYSRPLDVEWLCVSCHKMEHVHG